MKTPDHALLFHAREEIETLSNLVRQLKFEYENSGNVNLEILDPHVDQLKGSIRALEGRVC